MKTTHHNCLRPKCYSLFIYIYKESSRPNIGYIHVDLFPGIFFISTNVIINCFVILKETDTYGKKIHEQNLKNSLQTHYISKD